MKLLKTSQSRVPAPRFLLGTIISATIVLTASGDPTNCTPAPLGLVSWWAGEGTATDSYGTNNGTLQNGAGFAAGEVGQAFSFDGISGYMEVPKAPSLDVGSQLTIDFWMKADPSNPMNTLQGLVDSDFYAVEISSGNQSRMGVNFGVSTNSGAYFLLTSEANGGGAVISSGVWHHVAATYDGARLQLYIDGQPWGNPTLASGAISPMAASSFVSIGSEDGRKFCGSCTANRYFKGLIDEVDIFNRALSASEIAAIYGAGSAGKCGLSPSMLAQPQAQTAVVGSSVAFAVVASGTPPLSYQWQFNGTNLSSATGSSLTLTNAQPLQAGSYVVLVTNLYGATNSSSAILTVNSTSQCATPPSGLVAWWPAEGNANDRVGTNNGTLRGGATFAPGEVGEAFDFDGISGSVLIPDAPAVRFTNAMTVEVWIYPRSSGGTAHEIVSKWFGSGFQNLCYTTTIDPSGNAYILVSSDGQATAPDVDYKVVYTTSIIPLNQWSHFAATYDGAMLKVYLNGVMENMAPWTNGIFPGTAPLVIGECYSESLFNGLIDEASLYSRALSDKEIQAIYSAGSFGKCPLAAPSITGQPASQTVLAGATTTFTVTATGTPPLSYQWSFGGTNIAGATCTSLTLSNVQPAQAGIYAVQVTNAYGSTNSANALLTVNSSPPCMPAPLGLVGWWRGENNADDSVGGNNGTLVNGTGFAPGEVLQAFSFDGVRNFVSNAVPGLTNIRSSYTMEFWAWPKAARASTAEATSGILGTSNQRYAIFPDNYDGPGVAGAGVSVGTNGVSVFEHSFAYLPSLLVYDTPIAGWTHIAVVYTNRQPRLYLNGVLVRTGLTSGADSYPSTCLGEIGVGYGYYAGLLDEVSIYNRALSAAEIQAIYNAGTAGKCPSGTAPSITAQPASQTVVVGSTATFSVTALGTPPLSYQWRFSGTNIAGATGTSLTLNNVQPAQAGIYAVQISNAYGSTNSANALLTVNPMPPCTPPPLGLVGWWRGEGDATDAGGLNNGTLQGGATFAVGEVGEAFSFNPASGTMIVPDASNLRLTNQLTIEAWINPRTFSGPDGYALVSKVGGAGGYNGYQFVLQGNTLLGQFNSPGQAWPSSRITCALPIATGVWYHVAWTYDQSAMKLFFNGQPVTTNVIGAQAIAASSSNLRLSGDDNNHVYFDGRIDEASVYNRALTASEIQAIYNAGSAGKCPPGTAPSITGQPASQTVLAGATTTFTVTAAGTPPLSYQWGFNGTNIAGATSTSLTLSNVQPAQAGTYAVQVTNAYGSTNSANALLTVTSPPPTCVPVPAGLVAWWRAEGNALDAFYGNNGTMQGGATFAAGEVGQAFSFNGVDGSILVPDAPALRFTNAMTIEAWIYPKSVGTAQGILLKWFGNGNQLSYSTAIETTGQAYLLVSKNGLGVLPDADYKVVYTTDTVPLNQWTHFAGVYDGTWLKVYLNGVLENQALWTNGIFPGTAPLVIGEALYQSPFNGLIDEPSLYNRALTGTEIQQIYNAGSLGKCPTVAPAILTQPASQTVIAGYNATFTVTAGGTAPLSYQWVFNGTNMVGQTTSTLSLTNVQQSQAGSYSVVVSNAYGVVSSSIALLAVNPPPPCTPAPSGLVAWWRCEGNALDSSGTNNGTLQGGVTFAAGEVGQTFSFNGIDGSVLVPDAPALRVTNALTIEAWICPKSVGAAQGILLKWFGNGNQLSYSTAIETTGQAYLLLSQNGLGAVANVDYKVVYSTNTVHLNQWTHFAGVYDGAWLKVYLNGVMENQALWTNGIFPGTAPLYIGEATYQSPFNGLIDEPSVYNRALTDAEIQQIYNAGSAGKCPAIAPALTSQPASQTVLAGATATFTVTATGTPPLSYQWGFNGTNIAGATGTSLTLSNVQPAQAGTYSVQVTNAYGSTNSANAILTVTSPPPACIQAPAGLVSWWQADGTTDDTIGGNNGILVNGVGFANGEVGQAFSFDGVSDYVKIPKAANLDAPSQLTIDFWMKADTNNPIGSRVEGLVTSDFYGFEIGTAASTPGVLFFISTDSGGHFVNTADVNGTGAVFPAGEWHHIAGVYDGAKVQLYLDGRVQGKPAPVTGQISPMLANSFVAIGSSDGRTVCGTCIGTRYFKGLIDEVDIFNRALSASEVAAIYNAGVYGKCGLAPGVVVPPTNQVVTVGTDVILSVVARGTPPLVYQWQFNGTNASGGTAAILSVTNVQANQSGSYAVVITNVYGVATSSIALLTVNLPPPCVPPPLGLVSWWRGEGDCLDAVGTNNGTLQNGATFARGEVGQAFSFDGVNDYVKILKSASLDAPNKLTIDFWMKADTNNPIGSRVEGLVTSDFYGFEIGTAASTPGVLFFISTDSGGHFVNTADVNGTGAVFPAGEWHHIAGVYDGAKVQLYLDGQALGNPAPVTGQISPMLANSFVAIGSSDGRTACGQCFGSRYFNGMIDEVDFFNRALLPSEIAAIYSAGAAGKCLAGLAPLITAQPASQTVLAGSTAAFTVTATGALPLSYQWSFDGTNIAGATGTSLTLSNVQPAQAGIYAVQVTNAYGSTNSDNAFLTVTSPPPTCVPAPAGLVSWWQADGTADDTIGGNDGILVNSAGFATGEVGQAFSFDGVNDYVKIPRAPSLDVSNQVTIDLWMKADPSAPIGSRLEGLVSSDFYGMEVGNAPAGVYLFLSTDNGASFVSTADATGQGAIFPVGEWHHVAGTYDGAKLQFYLDGQPYGNPIPVSGAISPMLSSSFVTLGSEDGRTKFPFVIGTRYFAGEIDEADIFNRALSASEIAAIYSAGVRGKCGLAAAVVVPPTNQVVTVGADVSFTAVARGTPPLAYQWQFNGTNVSGGTTAILSVTNVQYSQSGSYSIVVTNAYGAATSSIAMLTINPPPPCTVPPAGLVSWWRGEGDALDESGVNSGTLQNGATFARGEVGQAFSFDGTNDFVKIPRAPNLDVGSQLTIDLWMKADPSAPIGSRLEGLVGSDFYGMEVGNAPAGVFLFISTNDGASFKTTADVNGQGAIFPVGEWHHVAGTYDGAKLQFFLDGQPYGNPTPASGAISPMLSSSFVTLGSEDGRTKFPFVIGTRYFAGELDEVDIFNRALSASEIAAIYQAGSTGKCRSPHTATATASLANGFVVGVTISNHGWGYTNTPVVKIIGGGGSGAQAVAVVSNGQLVAINILDAGSGYTNTPVVVIEPPFVPQLMVAIETASLLSFSSLAVGTNYQLQYFKGNTWSNLGAAFAASSPTFTQYVPGTVGSNDYRLATTPVPTQAYATAQLLNGFVIGATVTSGGSGYTTNPAVSIVGGGGSNATAVATVAGGVVTKITITDAGIGYTSTPSIVISPPPASALWPMVAPALALSLTNLSPYDNYQVEFTPALGGAWSNSGLPFTPTSTVNTQYVNEAGEAGFFRVKYVP